MIYVLYKNSGVHSGRALRNQLKKDLSNRNVRGGFPKFLKICAKKEKPNFIINLGTTDELGFNAHILNEREMVRAAANKKEARRNFAANEVASPIFFDSPHKVTPADLPVVGRTSFHSKGKGFWFCPTIGDVQKAAAAGATHFIQFVPNTREYRVHLFLRDNVLNKPRAERTAEDYLSVKVSEKVWEGKGQPNPNVYQKNHEFGWVFRGQQNRREEELDVVRSSAKDATAALGMDFGAVDVMYSVLRKQAFVLEVNSTPSLADENSDTCERYAKRICKIVEVLNKK